MKRFIATPLSAAHIAARKILVSYAAKSFADWYNPSQGMLEACADEVISYIRQDANLVDFAEGGVVGDWADCLDEILNDCFQD